jgi:regulatory protein
VKAERRNKPRPPLDKEGLERLALFYAGRYGTTRAKLKAYLARKVKERGWGGEREPPSEAIEAIEAIVRRFSDLGYVDDRAFAEARTSSLQRRGYGERRVAQALRAAGIADEDAEPARERARGGAWEAALQFARKRRLGPYAAHRPDRAAREKAFAAMVRAGHPLELVQKLLNLGPGDIPDSDIN